MSEVAPLTVAFVSGKGGVGKTTLAVAFARELSRSSRTVLLDLDFFNRGLTGLMRHGSEVCTIQKPQFIAPSLSGANQESWKLFDVGPNLLHVGYPDLRAEEIRHIADADRDTLAEQIKEFVLRLASGCGCEAVVIDCHGGPDNISFAACTAADSTLIISEPDKVTFFGTLHFLRQMDQGAVQPVKTDLRLVFNKVTPAFSGAYLTRFYNAEVRPQFSGKPLLAIFPLETYLTSEFEKTPFLTIAYPFSWLARKMRVLIFDLLIDKSPNRIPAASKGMLAPTRAYTRVSLGKTPVVMKLNAVLATIAIAYICTTAMNIVQSQIVFPRYQALVRAVDSLEIADALDHQKDKVPNECRSQPDVKAILVCAKLLESDSWRSFNALAQRLQLPHAPRSLDPTFTLNESADIEKSDDSYFDRFAHLNQTVVMQKDQDTGLLASKFRALRQPAYWLRPTIVILDKSLYGLRLFSLVATGWLFVVVLLEWTRELDKAFTCAAHTGSKFFASFCLIIALSLWAALVWIIKLFSLDIYNSDFDFLIWGVALPWVLTILDQTGKARFEVEFDHQYATAGARTFYIGCLVAMAFVFRRVLS